MEVQKPKSFWKHWPTRGELALIVLLCTILGGIVWFLSGLGCRPLQNDPFEQQPKNS